MRVRALLIPVLAALLAAPSAAHAAGGSITYVGSDGNVWLATPDGSRTKRVTTNASASLSYRSPSAADDGSVVVPANNNWFYVLDPDGTNARGPWLARINSMSSSPIRSQVSPGGSTIAFGYLHQSYPETGSWNLQPRVHFNSTSAPGSACGAPFTCHTGFSDPRWIHGTPYAGMISSSRSQLVVQGGSGTQAWLNATGEQFDAFDYSRAGNQALLKTEVDGTGQQRLYLWQNDGPPPAAGNAVCDLAGFGNADSAPRFSPDGTAITWHDARGVWVSPKPVSSGGRCALSPTLIVPGGKDPDWGAAALPADPVEEVPPPPAQEGAQPARPKAPGTPATPQALAQQQAKALAKTPIGRLLSRGWFRAGYRASGPGTLTIRLTKGRTVLAAARRGVHRAGRVSVPVKLTKAGRRTLRKAKRVRAKLTVSFAPRKGKRSSSSRVLTLKR